MKEINAIDLENQVKNLGCEEQLIQCNDKFHKILSYVLSSEGESAHEVEGCIFKQLLELGLLLLTFFFEKQNQGNYGNTIETLKGIAKRGRVSESSYFSIFGKIKVCRYLYHLGSESFAPLDELLNLPRRCYSYFLCDWINCLNIQDAFGNTVKLLKRFLDLELSVSAVETVSLESSMEVENYYEEEVYPEKTPIKESKLVAISFDGKGVPMIKKEAAKIKGRLGKGEKRQKKKEALVGVKYTIKPQPRTCENVAGNLIYPEKQKKESEPMAKAEDIRYVASLEKSKREVMREIQKEIADEKFDQHPLICLIDGAKSLIRAVKDVFQSIENKIIILDVIHVLEYIWLIANLMYKEGSEKAKEYVSEKLILILQGKVSEYINELNRELEAGEWSEKQQKIFKKVITYFENHKPYMKYHQYLMNGYPIATGVVESACGHLVKERMEIAGARWSIQGAESILTRLGGLFFAPSQSPRHE